MPGLSVSDIVNVTVTLQPLAAALRNFGATLIVGASDVIDTTQRFRQYSTLGQVASDFGSTAPEYLAADLFFSQAPQPSLLYIGRFAQTATSGILHGGPFSGTQQYNAVTALAAITTGSMSITVDGTAHSLSSLNFSAQTNMNGVAGVLANAMAAYAAVRWNAGLGRFDIESNSTGATSSVSYATPTGSGTDVSALLNLTAATGASLPVSGQVSETALQCVQLLANQSNDWYMLTFAAAISDSDHLAVAAFIEGESPSRLYGITTQEAGALSATSTTDIAYVASAALYKRTTIQYSTSSPYAVASLFGRFATVNFQASSSVITGMFQQEPGVTAEILTESQAAALEAKNCNVFVAYSNSRAIIQEAVMTNGYFIDEMQGTDWLQNAIQTAVFNLLYTRTTKVPQTDPGINLIVNTIDAQLVQAVTNGLVAPGVWQGPQIGQINTGDALAKGWYVYAQPIAQQAYADRVARKAPPIQVAICLAGAVHSANVLVSVTR